MNKISNKISKDKNTVSHYIKGIAAINLYLFRFIISQIQLNKLDEERRDFLGHALEGALVRAAADAEVAALAPARSPAVLHDPVGLARACVRAIAHLLILTFNYTG